MLSSISKKDCDTYGSKGEKVVNMNFAAVDAGINQIEQVEYPASWSEAVDEAAAAESVPDYVKNVVRPIAAQKGDELPVSAFEPDGTVPTGTTKYEKRGIALNIPVWISENCIQCNQCAFVCPHAAIRPFLAEEESLKNAPDTFVTLNAVGKNYQGLKYRIQVSALDCTGCGNSRPSMPGQRKGFA